MQSDYTQAITPTSKHNCTPTTHLSMIFPRYPPAGPTAACNVLHGLVIKYTAMLRKIDTKCSINSLVVGMRVWGPDRVREGFLIPERVAGNGEQCSSVTPAFWSWGKSGAESPLLNFLLHSTFTAFLEEGLKRETRRVTQIHARSSPPLPGSVSVSLSLPHSVSLPLSLTASVSHSICLLLLISFCLTPPPLWFLFFLIPPMVSKERKQSKVH